MKTPKLNDRMWKSKWEHLDPNIQGIWKVESDSVDGRGPTSYTGLYEGTLGEVLEAVDANPWTIISYVKIFQANKEAERREKIREIDEEMKKLREAKKSLME